MRVAIRTDSSERIGSGHVMRCLTLAEGLREQGAEVIFVCRELPGNLIDVIADKGFDLCRLSVADAECLDLNWNRHADWLGVHWRQDAKETEACLLKKYANFDWLIVDHYALEKDWESELRPFVNKIMVIDDLADRHHDSDLLLDQNYYRDGDIRYRGLLPEDCIQLLGPKYALLRPEFALRRQSLRRREDVVKRLFVFLGGADIDNVTGEILKAFFRLDRSDLIVDVVVGATNPHREFIRALCLKHQNLNYYCQVSNIADLMVHADLAVAAGGATTWERCCLGLPTLVVSTAVNQLEMCLYGSGQGLFHFLGRAEQLTADDYYAGLSVFTTAAENLSAFTRSGLELVDGKGGARVCSAMLSAKVNLRPAVADDCDAIHAWRNAEETRKHIFESRLIPLSEHRNWYAGVLQDPDRYLLVGEVGNCPIGIFRVDLVDEQAKVSIYLVPGLSGQGLGSRLLEAGIEWTKQNKVMVKSLVADIMPENLQSLKIFAQHGFVEHHREMRKQIRQ